MVVENMKSVGNYRELFFYGGWSWNREGKKNMDGVTNIYPFFEVLVALVSSVLVFTVTDRKLTFDLKIRGGTLLGGKDNTYSYVLLRSFFIKPVQSFFALSLFSISFGWFLRFGLVGYNFTFRNRLRRSLIKLNLGYSRHKFVINVPPRVRVLVKKKRKFTIFSRNFWDIYRISIYIQNLRNILPYKIRGLILEGSRMSVLKQGKKVKFR